MLRNDGVADPSLCNEHVHDRFKGKSSLVLKNPFFVNVRRVLAYVASESQWDDGVERGIPRRDTLANVATA